jgi:hypothetical protein
MKYLKRFNESVDLYTDEKLQQKAWQFCQRWDSDILFRLLGQDDEGNEVPMGDIRSLLNKVSDLGDYSLEEWVKFFEDLRENGI